MANEIGGIGIDEINSGGQVREDMNKVTEEAVRRVQDNQKKAQQVGQEIKKDKAINNKLAKFLAFLLSDIKNDTIIKQIYLTFFKNTNQEIELTHLKKNMNATIVIGTFIPFYQNEAKEFKLNTLYEDLGNFEEDINLTKYIEYIKLLLTKYNNNTIVDKTELTKLLSLISEYYQLIEKLSTEKAIEFENTLKKELSFNE